VRKIEIEKEGGLYVVVICQVAEECDGVLAAGLVIIDACNQKERVKRCYNNVWHWC
jgi:hypothetical protein